MKPIQRKYLESLIQQAITLGIYTGLGQWIETRPPISFKEALEEINASILHLFEREKHRVEKEVVSWIPIEPKED